MTPAPDFSRKQAQAGELVRLIPARREHAAVLHPLLADAEVSRLTGTMHSSTGPAHPGSAHPGPEGGGALADPGGQVPWSVDELAEIYARWSWAEDRIVWVIEEVATGRIVGESVLNDLDEDNLSLREALLFDGEWVDAHVMGILAWQWRSRRGGIPMDPPPAGP